MHILYNIAHASTNNPRFGDIFLFARSLLVNVHNTTTLKSYQKYKKNEQFSNYKQKSKYSYLYDYIVHRRIVHYIVIIIRPAVRGTSTASLN